MTLYKLPTRQLDRLASCSRISVQQQETCDNWKAPMERQPYGSNRDLTSIRISYWNEKELGTGNKNNRRSIENDEEAI